MQQHILYTKLQPPRVAPDILPRARLVDMLSEGRRRTLTLISAPAGYGKSTLACSWAAACDWPCGWVSLDQSDGDLPMFLSYVLAAIQSLFPETEFSAEAFLESNQKPSATALARYLLNDLNRINEPFILVLDDYHHIAGNSSVHDLLTEVLAHPPRTMHLVLLTRRDPPFSISRLRGNGQVTEIRASDLRFTPAEVSAFFNVKLKIPVDDPTARLLDEKMEGWVTGLRLAGLYLHDQDDLTNRVQELSGGLSNIAEYLIEEVLSKQRSEISAFLVETSILNRFCAPLCRAVHSRRVEERNVEQEFDAQGLIRQLVNANLFVIPLDDQDHWFRYHHLFQGFLQGLLRKQSNADTIAGLHLRASNWFAENGLIDEAIRHALAAGDTEAAVGLMLEHRYDLMNTAQFFRLQRWLALLPDDAVPKTPLLVSTKAFTGIEQGQDTDVYTCTQQAELMLGRVPPKSAEYGILRSEVHVLKGFIDMAVGNPESGLAHAEEAMESPYLSADAALIRSLGILTAAFCHQMMGNHRHGIKLIEKALLNPAWNPNLRARLHFYLSIVHYMNADLADAIASSSACRLFLRDLSFSHTRTFASYLVGAAYYCRNELAEAERHLMGVLDDFEPNNPSYVSNAAFVLACICLARDCKKESEQILSRVSAHFQANNYTTIMAIVRAFQVELSLRQGDIERARDISKKVVFDMRPPLWFFYVPQLTPIKLLLAEDTKESLNEARTRLVELDEQMARINRKNVRIDVLALMALVFHKSGNEAAALEHLQSALDLAEPGGWIRNFSDLGAPMAKLLERLIQLHPGHTYAQQILDAFRADAPAKPASDRVTEITSSHSGQAAAPILSTREIEILHLLAEGLSNKEIASRLHIATETVKTHLKNIYRKLNVKGGRVAALKTARTLELVGRD